MKLIILVSSFVFYDYFYIIFHTRYTYIQATRKNVNEKSVLSLLHRINEARTVYARFFFTSFSLFPFDIQLSVSSRFYLYDFYLLCFYKSTNKTRQLKVQAKIRDTCFSLSFHSSILVLLNNKTIYIGSSKKKKKTVRVYICVDN